MRPDTAPRLTVHALPAEELDAVRRTGVDVAGNAPVPWPDAAGVPLRCCLRRARAGEAVWLIAHAPLRRPSPWRELGPVFVHARPCAGYDPDAGLPPDLRRGPRVLRSYRGDGTLDYDAIRVVDDGVDLADPLRELLDRPDVAEVHVRALAEQCFTYLVRAPGRSAASGSTAEADQLASRASFSAAAVAGSAV